MTINICEKCMGVAARGIKKIKCTNCGKQDITRSDLLDVCNECANNLGICSKCGEEME